MKSVVIYESKYGATRKYAEWIAESLACDLFERKGVKPLQLMQYDTIVYGGGLYAGGVSGIKLLVDNFGSLGDKNIVLFTCGLADPTDPENIDNIRSGLAKVLTAEMQKNIKVFHLRGGIDYAALGFIHKSMMGMLYKMVKRKDPATLKNDEKGIIATYGAAVDFTDRETLRPLLDYISGL